MVASVDNERKQNILIVHNYYQIPSGEDTVVANEKKMLQDYGHKVILYSRNNSELKSMSKLQKLMLPLTTVFNPRTYRDIKRLIKTGQIDIVHVHNTLNLVSPAVYYAARAMKVPVVQTIHNFRFLCPGATFYRDGHICEDCVTKGLMCAVKHSCYRDSKIQTLACVISTKIHRMLGIYGRINYICLTDFNKEKLLQLRQIKVDRVYVKPNFVEAVGDEIIPCEKRNNQFIYVGRLDKLKGVDFLFEAWKRMGKSAPRLLVCGTGPLGKWCANFLRENPEVNIEMKGFVSNKEVRELIAGSKALLLLTQWYEGFPMTIVEAFSVGTPVIVSDLGNAGILIEEGINGMKIFVDDYSKIKIAINEIYRNKEIYDTTYVNYLEHYTESKNYEMLIHVYNTLTI